MVKNIMNPKQTKKLRLWQGRFETARAAYDNKRQDMDTYEAYYDGTREVQANPNTGKATKKESD